MNTKAKGYIYGSIAAITYGMNPLFTLPLYADGMNPDSVLFIRYLMALVILGIMIRWRGRNLRIQRKDILPLAGVGLLTACSSLFMFLSFLYIDAGVASTLLFVYPILVALIMAIFYKERLTLPTAASIALALGGIGLLYRGENGVALNFTGVILVMISALTYALYMVMVNRPRLREIPTVKLTFYVILFGLSVFLVRVDFGTSVCLPQHWYHWGNLLALALLPTAISFVATTRSVQYIGSTPTAILGALEPVTALFFGVTVFDERITVRIASGVALIIIAVTLIVAGGSITSYLVRFRKMFPKLRKKKSA